MKTTSIHSRILAPLLFVGIAGATQASTDFFRADFNDSQPFHIGFIGTGGGVATYTAEGSGGVPGSWGKISVHGQGAGGPDVIGYACVTFDDWQFDPATEGKLISVDSEADTLNYTNQTGFNLDSGLFIIAKQGTDYYVAGGGNGHGAPWFHEAPANNMLTSSFYRIDPLTGKAEFGPNVSPSGSGGVITFGFGMLYTYVATESLFTGVDNLHYHLNSVPEPTTMGISCIGLASLWRRRRLKK